MQNNGAFLIYEAIDRSVWLIFLAHPVDLLSSVPTAKALLFTLAYHISVLLTVDIMSHGPAQSCSDNISS